MSLTPTQIQQAIQNTRLRPRNSAQLVYQGIRNEKTGWWAGLLESPAQAIVTKVTYG